VIFGTCACGQGPHIDEVSQSRTEVLKESKKKGIAAGVAAAATVTLGFAIGAPVAAVAAVPTVILGLRWWKHRKVNGIRI
jgi:hypothetical protein